MLPRRSGVLRQPLSVAIKEIPQEKWKDKVYNGQIMADKDALYVAPGYTYD